jgi:uncharacterized damage-inducible protein DinB
MVAVFSWSQTSDPGAGFQERNSGGLSMVSMSVQYLGIQNRVPRGRRVAVPAVNRPAVRRGQVTSAKAPRRIANERPSSQGVFMSLCSHVVLLASYNEWMNAKLYAAAGRLPPHELSADRRAFFGSLLGTLNHIVVADTIWLKRFAAHPRHFSVLEAVCNLPDPHSLDQTLFSDIAELGSRRRFLDKVICDWAVGLSEEDLAHVLQYTNTKGVAGRRLFSSLVFHFFNHQTHHRGQASTLLFQAGVDIGVTDLVAIIAQQGNH